MYFKDFTKEVAEFDKLPIEKQLKKVEAMVTLLASKNPKFNVILKNYNKWKNLPDYNRMVYIRILRRWDFVQVYKDRKKDRKIKTQILQSKKLKEKIRKIEMEEKNCEIDL